ncbi:uncharacterized protein JCM6883_002823 [Sporobolomyces salmoneus]|uniref:uncharacterized protein n=1 Tax=Sporobolomyces salmoneus TaxID=183962 RepID=UPI0031740791
MRSFHEFIACSSCHRDYFVPSPSQPQTTPSGSSEPAPPAPTAPLPFYLTTCQHIICHPCLFTSKPAPQPLDQVRLPCPACQTITPLALLVLDDPTNEMSMYFSDLGEMWNTALMAAQFQLKSLMDQVEYLKPKCVQQKRSITRLLGEVKKGKGLKAENDQLRAEIGALQARLYKDPAPTARPIEIREDRFEDYRDQGVGHSDGTRQQYDENEAGEENQYRKRRAVEQSNQLEEEGYHPVYSPPHSQQSQDREASYDQLRPSRLTLTPASRASHRLHHWTRPETIPENELPPIDGIKSSRTIHLAGNGEGELGQNAAGRASRMSGGGSRGSSNGPASIKEHLSHFAYTPSASGASQRPSTSSAPPKDLPSTFEPPASVAQFDPAPRQLSHPPPASSHYSQPFSHDPDEDRRMMPPPPLPLPVSSSSIAGGVPRAPTPMHQTRPFIPSHSQTTPRSTPRPTPVSTPRQQTRRLQEMPPPPLPARRFGETGNATSSARVPFRPSG